MVLNTLMKIFYRQKLKSRRDALYSVDACSRSFKLQGFFFFQKLKNLHTWVEIRGLRFCQLLVKEKQYILIQTMCRKASFSALIRRTYCIKAAVKITDDSFDRILGQIQDALQATCLFFL